MSYNAKRKYEAHQNLVSQRLALALAQLPGSLFLLLRTPQVELDPFPVDDEYLALGVRIEFLIFWRRRHRFLTRARERG